MLDQFNSYRNKNGYINLDQIKNKFIINNNIYGSRNKEWLSLNGTKVLFIENKRHGEDIKEMVNQEISRYLKVSSANYDLAIKEGKAGVITLPFFTGKQVFLPAMLLLFQSKTVGNSNDILSIYNALVENNASNNELICIMNAYFLNQVQDIFTFQYDRNMENSGIILDDKKFLPGVRFDSAGSFLKFYEDKKINSFLLRQDRKVCVYNKNYGRTKLRITPTQTYDSIKEFIQFRYLDEFNSKLPEVMKDSIKNMDSSVEKMYNYNLKETFDKLSYYNINVSNMYQKLIKFCLDLSKERFEDDMNKIQKYGTI